MGFVIVDLNNVSHDDDPEAILKLLFKLNLQLGVTDISNVRHIKRDNQRINTCSMESNNMVGLVQVRR